MSAQALQFPAFPNRRGAWLMALSGFPAAIASAAIPADGRFVFLAAGLWALTIVLIPIVLNPRIDPFSMWSFVVLNVAVGVTLRGVCLTLGYPDAGLLDQLYFLGREPAFFFRPAGWLLLGLLMLSLGYVAIRFRECVPSGPFPYHRGRLVALCLALMAISTVATALYIQRTGGLEAGEWSAKRTVIPDLDLAGSGYRSHGGLRFVASLAIFGHLLALAELLSPRSRSRKRDRFVLGVIAGALLLIACAVPFYASLRTSVALNLCLSAAMVFYAVKRFSRAFLIVTAAILLLAIYVMTALRPSSPDRQTRLDAPTAARVFEAAVINRNQIELPKTAHIFHSIPGDLPLQYGKTIARWVLAPIPRSLWPDKPVIPPGPEIGRTVYGQRVAGVPPSLVAELFWNFHFPGVVVGAFGFGVLLRYLQARFGPIRDGRRDLFRTTLYVAGPMTLGFEAIGSSLGSGLFRAALHTVVMLGLLSMIRLRGR